MKPYVMIIDDEPGIASLNLALKNDYNVVTSTQPSRHSS